jgi:hypothetical protein
MPRVDAAALEALLAAALAGDPGSLAGFLRANSNLPGPRGNLELAWQFADAVAARAAGPGAEAAWRVASSLAAAGAEEAPTGDPGEFLAFCGTLAAAGFAGDPSRWAPVWEAIRKAAEDERWRLREAAAQAIQRAATSNPGEARAVLDGWAGGGSWLLCRAVAAGVADPPLLRDPAWAAAALSLHELILARLVAASDRRDAGFKVLRQGLGFSLSVVVAAAPPAGFALLRRLAAIPDSDLAWVLRSNLGKGRLTRGHAREVEEVLSLLGG